MKARWSRAVLDPTGWIGAAIMMGFAAFGGWRWLHSGLLYFALTALRDCSAAVFLITRHPDHSKQSFGWPDLLAYTSSAIVLLYFPAANSVSPALLLSVNVLSICGFAIATFALFDLGKSFGVSPANRGLVETGIYEGLRHPMYVGYGIAEFGCALLNPINFSLYGISLLLYFCRSKIEDEILRIAPP